MEKIDKLQQLMKLLQNDTITPQEVEKFLLMVVDAVKKAKEQLEQTTSDTVDEIYSALELYRTRYEQSVENYGDEVTDKINKAISDVTAMIQECRSAMPKDGLPGKDADEEYIISEVLNRIELPEQKEYEYDTGEDIVEKINQLSTDEKYQIDWSHIKNAPEATGGRLGSTARNLWQLNDVTLTDVTNDQVLKYNSTTRQWENGTGGGGGGTPGGSSGQVQYNNAGSFGGITGVTSNGTTMTFTGVSLFTQYIQGSTSAGVEILSNSGTPTALFGAGGGANSTFYGGSKFDYATASTVPYFDASKNLISSTVTSTELGYLSGVTSAIQTQFTGKQATLVSGTNIKTINGSTILGSGDLTVSASAAGSNTQLQFNNSSALGGAQLYYTIPTSNPTLTFGDSSSSANGVINTLDTTDANARGLSITTGTGSGSSGTTGNGGTLSLTAGGANGATSGDGGDIVATAGSSTAGAGGDITFTAGNATATGQLPGNITFTPGVNATDGVYGTLTLGALSLNAIDGLFVDQTGVDTCLWASNGGLNTGFPSGYSGTGNTIIGNAAGLTSATSAFNNILIGQTGSSLTDGNDNILIGTGATLASGSTIGGIAIGRSASAASNECVIGGNNASGLISQVYFGRGKTSATAQAVTIQIGGRSGTNLAGNAVTWASGKGTGNASTGGEHFWQTPDTTSSGSTLQSLTTKMTLTRAGLLGLGGSTTPTHTISMQSTGTGIAMYNTADQTTNFERLLVSWSTNVCQLYVGNNGSGTLRQMRIGSSVTYFQSDTNAGSPSYKARIVHTSATSANGFEWSQAGGFTASSGSQVGFAINQTVNQTSTAGFTDLLVNRTQTAVGSGTQSLIDLQVGGTSEFRVDNVGRVITTNVVRMTGYTVAGLPTGTEGDVAYVTDQLTTPAAKGVAPTGGGSVRCMVFFNGTAWVGI